MSALFTLAHVTSCKITNDKSFVVTSLQCVALITVFKVFKAGILASIYVIRQNNNNNSGTQLYVIPNIYLTFVCK